MSDFFQNGIITTLHTLSRRPIEALEEELAAYSRQRPMALILPSLYSELEGPALPNIVENLKSATYISDIIVGLDDAGRSEFEKARRFFKPLPHRVHILWHNGERLKAIHTELKEKGLSPQQAGKGRNVWYCMGYALGIDGCEAVALHDCDITTYDRYLPEVCQVDIADRYDHKHQTLSEEKMDTGLSRMNQEISKSIYRKLATEGIDFSTGFFRTVKACYYRMALDCIEQYYFDSQINDLAFDRHVEEQSQRFKGRPNQMRGISLTPET